MQDLLTQCNDFLKDGVSDIYIHTNQNLIYKLQGKLLEGQFISKETIENFIQTHLSCFQKEAFYQGKEQDLGIKHKQYFIRMHLFLSQNNPALILRLLPQKIIDVLHYQEFLGFKNLLDQKGLILITGATGSGKTTTANALLHYINTNFSRHIVCVEDPIEFMHNNQKSCFTYREVGKDTESFQSGIISAMRQDPDVIFVGELREKEAILSALLASKTGHLVIATIHGKDSTSALMRFLNTSNEKSDEIAESLLAIVAQQKLENQKFIFEVLLANHAVKTLIKEQKFHQIQNQIFLSQVDGMVSFQKSLELSNKREL
ncbi:MULTISPECIES: type IV pilus twitching motility protein PilT [unclassified Helicobacter]|uniref:type IV pilus twitching motility protein PilT n=1 Tax=unclassified Helicobacter TaxID=2593540 RepID=UPI000CF136EC|nr:MULTISPECIES: ATPase, T2SS/T4P/T4SS family [unclassified Helicobacter]